MFDLSGSVGLGGRNARHDVALVQMALGVIKRRTKSGMKPYYDRRIDGRFGGATLEAIRAFLADNQVKATRPKIERSGPTYSALRRALPSQFSDVHAMPETAVLFRDRGGREAAAQRARETLTKIPLPDKARAALAKAQKEIGVEMILVIAVQDRGVTRTGAFSVTLGAPQAEWLDPLTRQFRSSREIPIQARQFVRQRLVRSSEWRGTGAPSLSIETTAAIAALQGPPKLTAAQERLYGRPTDPVIRTAVAAAAKMIAEGGLQKPKRNREFALLLQAVKVAAPQSAKKLIGAADRQPRNKQLAEKVLKESLDALKIEAANFARILIKDSNVRVWYLERIEKAAKDILSDVRSGRISPEEAFKFSVEERNALMIDARKSGSSFGLSMAERLKEIGRTESEILRKNTKFLFPGKNFDQLTPTQQTKVYVRSIERAAKGNTDATEMAKSFGRFGKTLWVLTFIAAAYSVAVAENRIRETARQGVITGGGVAVGAGGGVAAGAFAGTALGGAVCVLGAPVCVAVAIIIFGVLGSLAAEVSFDALF